MNQQRLKHFYNEEEQKAVFTSLMSTGWAKILAWSFA